MTDVRQSLIAAVVVLCFVAALVAGHQTRTTVEIGSGHGGQALTLRGALASNEKAPAVSESEFFYQLTQLLEREYVDPIADADALAVGAIRGMVASLADPDAQFFNKDQFAALRATLGQGGVAVYKGIGAELKISLPPAPEGDTVRTLSPNLNVVTVVPGGPADKAGLRPGDTISAIDGRWVPRHEDMVRLREIQTRIRTGKMSTEEFEKVRSEFRAKWENRLTHSRARDALTLDESGSLHVEWRRGEQAMSAMMPLAKVMVKPVVKQEDGSYRLNVIAGSGRALAEAIAKSSEATIDLRRTATGDFRELDECLAALVPAGVYGYVESASQRVRSTVRTDSGRSGLKLRVIADESTRGAAAALAHMISGSGAAKVDGIEKVRPVRWIEAVALPDGSGYTLPTGKLITDGSKTGVKK